jgi:Uncharacterised nucleotidyltransferase
MSSTQAERRLILLSAGTAVRRRAMGAQAERLAGEVDWPRLAQTLSARRLLPTLGPRIVELADGSSPDGFADAVEQALAAGRRQGALLQLVTLRILAALADAGIRGAPLKGPLLSESIYGDPGRRRSSDIDLLVAPERLREAVEVVRGLGYSAPSDHVSENDLPLLHFALTDERGKLPTVELHWRVHWYERRYASERLLPPANDPRAQWRPAPADELTALLLFYARDGFVDLRTASDLGAWWDARGAELAPGALAKLLSEHPALARAVLAAGETAERMVGLPARRILTRTGRLGARERVAVRLANPNPRSSQSQLYADMGLVDGLLAPAGGLREFVRRQLLPAPEVLDQQAKHGSRARARSRLSRCTGVLARYGLRLARLVRAPETPA